ncbi:MAG: DUF3761 domain-containing protein [Fibromonadales bacterium]|nr:DUF3761 domain-containing protein [Fibromonadales bacterium]
MNRILKIAALFVALTTFFSFSQGRVNAEDSLKTSPYYLMQVEKSCPNGSYTNSKGNTVCSPSKNNVGGATAICKDGTYSYSQSRQGTCSRHGGVAR